MDAKRVTGECKGLKAVQEGIKLLSKCYAFHKVHCLKLVKVYSFSPLLVSGE